jgi:hypothetical protein
VERPFTAAERGKVTILVGGITWKHDNMFKAVFEGCGYKCKPFRFRMCLPSR